MKDSENIIDENNRNMNDLRDEVEIKDTEIRKLEDKIQDQISKVKMLEREKDQLHNRESRITKNQDTQVNNTTKIIFKCDKCEKGFGTKRGLMQHMRVHQDFIPQMDGLDSLAIESLNDGIESSSLSRLKALTEGPNSGLYFRR